eukprot:5871930-Prymnesium_polylepis.1
MPHHTGRAQQRLTCLTHKQGAAMAHRAQQWFSHAPDIPETVVCGHEGVVRQPWRGAEDGLSEAVLHSLDFTGVHLIQREVLPHEEELTLALHVPPAGIEQDDAPLPTVEGEHHETATHGHLQT